MIHRVALFVFLCGLGYSVGTWVETSNAPESPPAESAESQAGVRPLQEPSPAIPPEQVARLQVEALGNCLESEDDLQQCYVFASPGNRQITGPLPRFAQMLLSPDYKPLVTAKSAQIGKPTIQGDQAAVLVTIVDHENEVSIYYFFPSKQSEPPYRDCWMTDGVVAQRLTPAAPPRPPDPGV